jgi:hypothetical protein
MEMDPQGDRPVLHCFVGYFVRPFGVIGLPKRVPLVDVPHYLQLGFWAIGPDPEDELALRIWEAAQRHTRPSWS